MEQGIQSNFPHKALKADGCYFFCLLHWAELLGVPSYTTDKILSLFDRCVAAGYVESDCFIVNPVEVLNMALGKPLFTNVYKKEPPMPISVPYALQYLKKPDHGHFVLASNNQKIWDSLDPNRVGVLDYIVDSYRIIT